MNKYTSLFAIIIVLLSTTLLFAELTFHPITSIPLSPTQTTTYFSGNFTCDGCTTLEYLQFTFPTTTPVTSGEVKILYINPNPEIAPIIHTGTIDMGTQRYSLPSIVPTNFKFQFYISLTFSSPHYSPPYYSFTSFDTRMEVVATFNQIVQAMNAYTIATTWVNDFSTPKTTPDVSTTIPTTTLNTKFEHVVNKNMPGDILGYQTTITFNNFYEHEDVTMSEFDLLLSGPVYWYVNNTHPQYDQCLFNGQLLTPILPYKNNQTLTFQIPSTMQPKMFISSLTPYYTLICGSKYRGLQIVRDTKAIDSAKSSTIILDEYLSIIPKYTIQQTDTNEYPLNAHVIKLSTIIDDKTLITTVKADPNIIELTPMYSFIDKRLGGESSAYTTMFEVQLDSIEQYYRQFEIQVNTVGITPNQTKVAQHQLKKTTPAVIPRVIINFEPDYTVEVPQVDKKEPKVPKTLFSPYYILPLQFQPDTNQQIAQTPTLLIENGFLDQYNGGEIPSFAATTLPKRIITVIIPNDPIQVNPPGQITLTLRFINQYNSDEKFPISKSIVTILPNQFPMKDNKEWLWNTRRVSRSGFSFEINKMKKEQTDLYPTNMIYTLPTLNYRFSFSNLNDVNCTFARNCMGTAATWPQPVTNINNDNNEIEQNEFNMNELIINDSEHITNEESSNDESSNRSFGSRRSSRSRYSSGNSCRYTTDNSTLWSPIYLSQNRIELDIKVLPTPTYVPDTWRRVTCQNIWLVRQHPLVKDFRSSTDTYITSNSAQPTQISQKWNWLEQSTVSTVVSHQFKTGASVTSDIEIYKLGNDLSTATIIILALIPLYIAVFVVIIVLLAIFVCKCCD